MYTLFFIITFLTNKVNDKQFRSVKDKINLFKRNAFQISMWNFYVMYILINIYI